MEAEWQKKAANKTGDCLGVAGGGSPSPFNQH